MKSFIAILIVLSSFSAFAVESESRCGQVDDSVDRADGEVASSSQAGTADSGTAGSR
jgi:hypothetical protein